MLHSTGHFKRNMLWYISYHIVHHMSCNITSHILCITYNYWCVVIWLIFNYLFFQTGDNCLVQLASRYTQELQRLVGSLAYTTPSTLINCAEVLQQLEDLRLAEWSDHAPPPPSAPLPGRYNNTWQSILNIFRRLG